MGRRIALAVIAVLLLILFLALVAPAAIGAARRTRSIALKKAHVLDGVYHPSRLVVMRTCQRASGMVRHVILEEDGDLHIRFHVDATYVGLKNSVNDAKQHGDLVVEFMPRDGRHPSRPHTGDRLTLVDAWVDDTGARLERTSPGVKRHRQRKRVHERPAERRFTGR